MPLFEVDMDGETFEVDAPDLQLAAKAAKKFKIGAPPPATNLHTPSMEAAKRESEYSLGSDLASRFGRAAKGAGTAAVDMAKAAAEGGRTYASSVGNEYLEHPIENILTSGAAGQVRTLGRMAGGAASSVASNVGDRSRAALDQLTMLRDKPGGPPSLSEFLTAPESHEALRQFSHGVVPELSTEDLPGGGSVITPEAAGKSAFDLLMTTNVPGKVVGKAAEKVGGALLSKSRSLGEPLLAAEDAFHEGAAADFTKAEAGKTANAMKEAENVAGQFNKVESAAAKEHSRVVKEINKANELAAAEDAKAAAQQAVTAAKAEADRTVQGVLQKRSPAEVGALSQKAVKRGSDISKTHGSSLYAAADQELGNELIDISAHKQELTRLRAQQSLQAGGGSGEIVEMADGSPAPNTVSFGDPSVDSYIAKVQLLPDEIPYSEARQLQKYLGSRLPGAPLSANAPKSLFKHLWGDLTTSIEEGVSSNPVGSQLLSEANAHHRTLSNTFKRGLVPQLAKAYPEDFVKRIPLTSTSRLRAVKEAVLGQAMEFGTPAEKLAAQEAWSTLSAEFTRSKLIGDDITKLAGNLEKAERAGVLAELPPEMTENLKKIAASLDTAKIPAPPLERYLADSPPPTWGDPMVSGGGGSPSGQIIPEHSVEELQRVLKAAGTGNKTLVKGALGSSGLWAAAHYFHIPISSTAGLAGLGAAGMAGLVHWAIQNPATTQMLTQALKDFSVQGGKAFGPLLASYSASQGQGAQ